MEMNDEIRLAPICGQIEPVKLSVHDTIFYVNPKTNAVGCKLYFSIKGPADLISAIEAYADVDCYEVTAEAHVAPGDTFDIEVGKKIARAKAETMAYRNIWGCLQRIAARMVNVLNYIDDFGYKVESVVEHNDNYLATF